MQDPLVPAQPAADHTPKSKDQPNDPMEPIQAIEAIEAIEAIQAIEVIKPKTRKKRITASITDLGVGAAMPLASDPKPLQKYQPKSMDLLTLYSNK